LLTGCQGCRDSTTTAKPRGAAGNAVSDQYREELLTYAVDNLNRVDEFESADVVQQLQQRLTQENRPEAGQSDSHIDPLLAVWPEPEMLRQAVDRLNQWIRAQQPSASWKLDPMVAALPRPLADLPQVKDLDKMEFSHFDGYALREAIWLRDIGRWARGDALDDLERAKCLFDWTVRNIQLDADDANRVPVFPWEVLLFGRGTATERAWAFILLARQLGIDAAMLALDEPAGPLGAARDSSTPQDLQGADTGQEGLRLWCVAVRIEGNAYLFEPVLGLPIPAPGGITLQGTGQLAIQPATLAQVVADEKLLRQLDIDNSRVYRVKVSDRTRVVALLEASPTCLAQRMKLLESRLVGERKMVLTTSPNVQAEHWRAIAHVAEARLWRRPWDTLQQRSHLDRQAVQARLVALLPFYAMPSAPLHRGRVLHLKGRFIGEDGATFYYQKARPSHEVLSLPSVDPVERVIYLRGKQDASYWSGLIAYQREKYDAAFDYFLTRTLMAAPTTPWISGAQYNLARTYEAVGDIERAILQYENNTSSPGHHGELLRAKWLKNLREEKRGQKAKGG
jgi:hypothetical protein